MSKKARKPGRKRAGSRILLQIVVLVVIVFIASGIVSFLFFRNSQSHLIQKSKDKLIENLGNLMCSTNEYVVNLQSQIQLLSFPGATPESMMKDIATGIMNKSISPQQEVANDMLRTLVDNGFWNSKLVFYAIPPIANINAETMVVVSSDNDTIYKGIPKELVNLVNMKKDENKTERTRFNDNNSYMFFADGIPELGLEGEYLVSAYRFTPATNAGESWYFDFSSIHDELAAIDSYYKTERGKIDTTLILVMIGSFIALIIVTFFVLNYLIRKKITKPIDELEDAADKVMEGDFDVQVPASEGEEFYGLKIAFNNMLASLRVIINMSMGGETAQTPWIEEKEGKPERKKRGGRSSILLPVTVVIVIIFIISGGLSLLFFNRSNSKLVDKSKEQFVRSEAQGITSGHFYVSTLVNRYSALIFPDMFSPQNVKIIFDDFRKKKISGLQDKASRDMKDLIDRHFCELDLIFYATPAIPGLFSEPTIFCASKDKYIYMKLPDNLLPLIEINSNDNKPYRARVDKRNSYMFVKDGIPELGIKGEYLVMAFDQGPGHSTTSLRYWFFDTKPMGKQLAEIDSFYSKENETAIIWMSVVILISIIAVAIITLFVLSYLIKSRITKPIDELSAVAEEVMEGNLEIEIPVNKGEEFESIKRAFNEMLKSLNELVTKSMD